MEKDQLDSLATVAVGSEKMPPAHSHYAASDVYSASESPPAYTRPAMKSTAVQIARIIATTMIAISVIIGSFILAAAWLQARATCTPESIAAMRAQSNSQQSQHEFIKHLQPEALIQDRDFGKDNLQSLSESSIVTNKDEISADTKKIKIESEEDEKSKSDNENGDENDSDDDYDDSDFPPVHIKLPLQLDLDDLAGSLLQQARSIVSCVVERHRSDELMDGENDNEMDSNSTERQRGPRLRGEHVAVLCESADPRHEQQDQEMLTPIIVPLGTVQLPLQPQDRGYNSYQVHNQYQVPDTQRVPMPADARPMNAPFPIGIFPHELRNIPQVSVEMGPPPRVIPQPHMMRPQPMPMNPMHAMKPSAPQDQFIREQQQQHIPITFVHASGPVPINPRQQHTQGMMPPPPPPSSSQTVHESQASITEPRILSLINGPRAEPKQAGAESQEVPDRLDGPFRGIPVELRRIIQQVPLEINNIIQHITGESRSVQTSVPEGARREQVQEFKPFPESMRPIAVDPFALPDEVRNLLEHGNIEGNAQQSSHDAEEQEEQGKPLPASHEQTDEAEKRFPVPTNVMNIIHEIMEGRAFPIPRFAMPLRPMESLEIPMEAQAQVSEGQATDEENQEQQEQQRSMPQQQQHQPRMMMHQEEMQDEANRPHFVQPRSVRSVPEAFAHSREKRVRRRACNCVC